jgi:hypothetical protein
VPFLFFLFDPVPTMANNANDNNKKRKKAHQQQPLCLQSTVEQVARKLCINYINNSSSTSSSQPSLSSVEDQFRLLGTRVAVGRLCNGWDTVERRAAVLLQQHYGLPWNDVAAALGAPLRDVKKFELLQHVVRNHLQPVTATATAPRRPALARRSSRQRAQAPQYPPAVVDEDHDDDQSSAVVFDDVDANRYTPQVLPSLIMRLSSGPHLGDDPHGMEQRAVALLRFIHSDQQQQQQQQQRADSYELRRYAAAYEAAAVVVVVTAKKKTKNAVVPVVEAVVTAAAGACTRLELRQVLPHVREAHVAMLDAAGSGVPPQAAGTTSTGRAAGRRLAAAASLKKRKADHQEQQQRKHASLRVRNARTERPDGDHDDDADSDVGASWFAQSISGRDDTFATTTTMDNGRHDDVDDEWKNNVLEDARKEHDGSLERAALHVLAQLDCHLV